MTVVGGECLILDDYLYESTEMKTREVTMG